MKKYIFITNGMARCGKDTFAMFLGEFVPTLKYSSIDKVKSIAKLCGWGGGKTEKDRKFLSDLKTLTSEYSNMSLVDVLSKIREFNRDDVYSVMLIDIREPKEIENVKIMVDVGTILIKNDRVPMINSNTADANVFYYDYDFVIENNGTLEEFREKVRQFAEENILIEKEND